MKMFITILFIIFSICTSCDRPRYAEKSELRVMNLNSRGELFFILQARERNTATINWTEIYRTKVQKDVEDWVKENIKSEADLLYRIDSANRSEGLYKQF